MTEKLKQVIKREIENLPKENQEAIGSVDWVKITEEIGNKYFFNESDLNDFQTQTLLVLIGVEDADFYAQNVENEVGTSKKIAGQISEEVFQKIFNPIGKAILEKNQKSTTDKDVNHEQNISFILSGGNSSISTKKETPSATPPPATNTQRSTPTPSSPASLSPGAEKAPDQENKKLNSEYKIDPYREKPE